uniref:Apple domain-containing protein n=1 Tax=viral metagenome TaxID=1070528 RepID=A0A6C0JC04_9ZZZZ
MYFNKKKELFISPQMNAKLLNGIKLNMGEIENIDELEIQKLSDDSEKLVILNIIKNYSVKNLLFSKNLELVNYKESNILGNSIDNIGGVASIVSEEDNIDGQMTNKFELKYNNITLENIHNIPVSFAVGNDFSTDKKNPYYGIQIKYKIKNTSHNNRAEIGIDFKSYMDIPIGKLIEMNEVLQDPDYKNLHREKVEVITKETKKLDFLPYFKNTDIKALVLFKDTKNKEFLNSLEGYFNLVDEKGNRILTKCKLDTPFCKAHILPKGKIYGRDKYIVGKYIPSGNNFQVLGDDEQIAKKKAVDAEKAKAAAAEKAKAAREAAAAREEVAARVAAAKAVENAKVAAAKVAADAEKAKAAARVAAAKAAVDAEKAKAAARVAAAKVAAAKVAAAKVAAEDWNCINSKLGTRTYHYSEGDKTIRNYTKDQCKTKCSGDEKCKAFDFNTMKLDNKTYANGDKGGNYYTTCRLFKRDVGTVYKNTSWGAEAFQHCSKPVEGFVGNFQDKEQIPQDYLYQKFLTKKDCVKDIDIHTEKISSSEYLKEPKLDLIANSKTLAPLKRLGGNKCIKHHDEFRDDYFFGGLDKDNNMFCYGKNNDCILFSDKPECEKLNLEKLLSVPLDKSKVKGINYQNDRTYYDKDSLTIKKNKMGATFKDDNGNLEIKCDNGKYLEGTFNVEDELSIIGGIYKDCKDPNHPNHDSCSPSISSSTLHLAELITTKGNKKYDADKSDKYSKFGDLDGKCIDNNIPDGRNIECDPLDNQQPCYVGDRPSLTPGESQPNIDLYNKYLGFNCNTYTLDSNTCKHNNNGVLSDVISFSTPLEENYLNIMDEQEILEVSNNLEENLMSDSEKYDSKNLHFYIEKYFERYENMNPNNHINPRYTIKFDTQYDMLSKNDKVILNIYYKGEKETTLLNNSEETYSIEDDDIIEILLQKNNHLVFKIRRDTTDLVKYTSIHKLEGEYSSPINFFISQNNNSFFRDIKYKEEIPSTVLPYNPFIDVRQE